MADYDITKLEELTEIEVESALNHYGSYQQYFNELDTFVNASKHYLRTYNPTVVIYNEDIRKAFIAEARDIRTLLHSLGMTAQAATLTYLEHVAGNGSVEILSDGLIKFYAEMDIMERNIISARGTDAKKPIILAVDDQPAILASVADMLKDRFTVMAVTSGVAALKVIEKHTPRLFLLDIEMTEMDGFELAGEIRKYAQFKTTPIIFLTSRNSRDDVVMAIGQGCNDYILKPVGKELLLQTIRKHFK